MVLEHVDEMTCRLQLQEPNPQQNARLLSNLGLFHSASLLLCMFPPLSRGKLPA